MIMLLTLFLLPFFPEGAQQLRECDCSDWSGTSRGDQKCFCR